MKSIWLVLGISVSFFYSCLATPQQASYFYQQGEYEKAEREYLNIIQEKPYDYIAHLNLASLYKELGEYDKATDLLMKFLSTKRDRRVNKDILFLSGELYYLKGESKRALDILIRVNKENPYDWKTFLYLGLIYEDLGKFFLAKKFYYKALKLKKNSLVTYRLAKVLYKEKKYKQAVKYFKETISLDSSIRLAYYYLGMCLYKEKKYRSAYTFLAKAGNFYPQDLKVKKALTLVKNKLGEKFFLERARAIEKKRKEIKFASYTKVRGNIPSVKVKILEAKSFTFKAGGDFKIYGENTMFSGKKNTFYTLTFNKEQGKLSLYDESRRKELVVFGSSLTIDTGNYPLYILGVIYGKGEFWYKRIDNVYRGNFKVVLRGSKMLVLNVLNLEEYLYGVIGAEIPPDAPFQALKAQAVAARTIAIKNLGRHKKEGFDFCSDIHCQVYRGLSVETERIREAVDQTRGEVIMYHGSPVEAFYHANSGGCLRGDAFGRRGYLFSNRLEKNGETFAFDPWQEAMWFKEEPESFCKVDSKNFRWQRVYDRDDFALVFGVPLNNLRRIIPKAKGDCAHIREIEIVWKDRREVVKGDLPIRKFLGDLKSSAFKIEIKYRREKGSYLPEKIFIWGAGFGHGAGMSQEGAIRMAEQGKNYKSILSHYYKGIKIKKVY